MFTKGNQLRKGIIPWNKGLKTGLVAWNKDKKCPSISKAMIGNKNFLGKTPWNKGKKCPHVSLALKGKSKSKEFIENLRKIRTGWKLSEDSKKKISLSHKGMQFSLKHRSNISKSLKKKERGNYYKEIGLLGAKALQFSKQPTSIEKKVYDELKARGLLFETQKIINGKFLVDAYIPSLNLIIEADGVYWHNLDRVKKKDKAENAYLDKCGFNVLRLSEDEINNGTFKERLPL